jgi:hypothetical protein
MLRRTTLIFLFIVLAGSNAATPATLCAPSEEEAGGSPQNHCKMARMKTPTPMNCCRHAPVSFREQDNKGASGCCQMSAPLPNQPRPALPGNSSQEFRQETRAQLLDSSEPISPSALTLLLPGWVSSTLTFCPDRSDTYLLASTFRI